MALINKGEYKYFTSDCVRVFPCAYRGTTNETDIIDPEARMHTESNYASISGVGAKTRAIKYPDGENGSLELMIAGYYIKISDADLTALKPNATLGIKLVESQLVGSNSTTLLGSFEETSDSFLDLLDEATGKTYFSGLVVSDGDEHEEASASISIVRDGEWDLTSLAPNLISHGEAANSVKIGTNIQTSKEGQIAIGADYEANSASDVAIASGGSEISVSAATQGQDGEISLTSERIVLNRDISQNSLQVKLSDEGMHISGLSEPGTERSDDEQQADEQLPCEFLLIGSGHGSYEQDKSHQDRLYRHKQTIKAEAGAQDDPSSISYVSEISQSGCDIKYEVKELSLGQGALQGELKVNGTPLTIKGLTKEDEPEFAGLTLNDGKLNLTSKYGNSVSISCAMSEHVEQTTNELAIEADKLSVTAKAENESEEGIDLATLSKVKRPDGTAKANLTVNGLLKADNLNLGAHSEFAVRANPRNDLTSNELILTGRNAGPANHFIKIVDAEDETQTYGELSIPARFYKSARFLDSVIFESDAEFEGAAVFKSTANFAGLTSSGKLTVTGDGASIAGKLMVTGDGASITGGLEVIGGAASIADKLTVRSGGASIAGNVSIAGETEISGAVTAMKFIATSDRLLKENLTEYAPKGSVLDLPVYRFDFVNGPKNNVGCMAQDLREICPEIVREGEDGYLAIEESKLAYLLLLEVKKLREELDELKRADAAR